MRLAGKVEPLVHERHSLSCMNWMGCTAALWTWMLVHACYFVDAHAARHGRAVDLHPTVDIVRCKWQLLYEIVT